MKDILKFLTSYTQMHFKFEEECMNRCVCPVADKNKTEHEKFLAAIGGFQREIRFKDTDKEMLSKVHNAAVNWIQNHIMRIDTHLQPCVNKKQEAEKVEILEWDDAYSTVTKELDEHHKYLFEAINELGESINNNRGLDVLKDILAMLTNYTSIHFKFEEHCMNRLDCPVADKNQSEHAKFLNAIEKFQRDIRFKEPDKEMLYKVHNAVVNWLKNHIMRIDTDLKACPSSPGMIESDKGVTGIQ